MLRRVPLLVAVAFAAAACSDGVVSTPAFTPVPSARSVTAGAARERLAQALALALADPETRALVKRRLDASHAREGKLQFQALIQTTQGTLMAALARASAMNAADLTSNLEAARGLELYLPVAAQRAAWTGDARYLVGTIGGDAESAVGFDSNGGRHPLDPKMPPDIPVLALVPQETDFTRGHPENVMACADMCGGDTGDDPAGGGSVQYTPTKPPAPGLYLIQSHFEGSYESWLKGAPEYEYHVYGIGDNGQSVLLACTSENSGGGYNWDQNGSDWNGSAMLLSDADYNAYQVKHPGAPIRIVAWEDDDESCVDHADVNSISALISAVDAAYKSITSGKVDPWYVRGIKAAPSIFTLISAIHNVILTNDDFIGNAVEGTVTGDAPNGSNWVLKTDGQITTGWFTTMRQP